MSSHNDIFVFKFIVRSPHGVKTEIMPIRVVDKMVPIWMSIIMNLHINRIGCIDYEFPIEFAVDFDITEKLTKQLNCIFMDMQNRINLPALTLKIGDNPEIVESYDTIDAGDYENFCGYYDIPMTNSLHQALQIYEGIFGIT